MTEAAGAGAADPHDLYRTRKGEREASVRSLDALCVRYSWLRLAIGIAAAGLLWSVVGSPGVPWPWLFVPAVAFVVVIQRHDVALRRRARAQTSAAHYGAGLARLEGRWAGAGDTTDYADPAHPYASDLDLFGNGSLFDLISRARTRDGARLLASWLSFPAGIPEIRARHAAIDELRQRWDLREDLAILRAAITGRVPTDAISTWGEAESPLPRDRAIAILAALLGPLNLAGLAWWLSGSGSALPLAATAALSIGLTLAFGRRVRDVLHAVEAPSEELRLLSETLARLAPEAFRSDRMVALHAAILPEGRASASRRIADLARLSEWNDSRHNPLFAPFSALLLVGTQLAAAIERWRRRSGRDIRRWLEALAELETLASLAGYAAENPADPYPELVEQGPLVDAHGIGHPLLLDRISVKNDVRLDQDPGLLVVSGSNMSGKSTLLRSVGLNTALALAGAPVRARALRVSVLQIGACMRVHDSIQSGTSHFYAEILRLKLLVDLGSRARPLLFLLDEVFHGTNSHDRRVGAEALVRSLLAQGGIGLVTTHDLALAKIAEALAPRAANVHFVDHFENGRMIFDYRMRPGEVRKSNALALMRSVGLSVPDSES